MQIQLCNLATVVTEHSYSETSVNGCTYTKDQYKFDNGMSLVLEENYETTGWHTYRMFYLFNGVTFKLEDWNCNGREEKSKELKMPHVINLQEVMHQYDRDPVTNNRLAKLASLSVSSQTLLEREMPYLVA